MKRSVTPLALLLLVSCGGSTPVSSSPAISVGGGYDIRKTTTFNSCNPGSVGSAFNNPGEVRQTPGQLTLVLNDHGTRDLPGTLNRDGTFALAPSPGLVMNTIRAVDTFDSGRFTTLGFHVQVT